MKRLLLIRHGTAAAASHGSADFERPLTSAGEQEVAAVGDRLAASDWIPQLIVASAAPRALATAALLASRLGRPPLVVEDELYLAGREALRRAVARHGGEYRTLALVAHNPGLTLLIRELAQVRLDDLPTAGVAGIALDSGSWREPDAGRLEYFDAPLWG